MSGSERERELASFSVLKKTETQAWRRNGVKNTVQEFLDYVFFSPFPPHAWDSVFFHNTEIGKFFRSNFLTFFRTRALDTH